MAASGPDSGSSSAEAVLERTARRCRERNIVLPTLEQMAHPERIPPGILDELRTVAMEDVHPRNLFRISWKNEPVERGGLFGGVNHLVLPPALTGVAAPIVVLCGRYLPTGAHKVGACYWPLVEGLVSGSLDPARHKVLWPSTGNYCRGGAFNSALLGAPCVAVLPEGMSRERFDWLGRLGAEVHATPGSEANVKEVFDKTAELARTRPQEIVVLNQFSHFGNPLWHYAVTGPAMAEAFEALAARSAAPLRLAGVFATQGSAGTVSGCGAYLRQRFPGLRVGAGEALECPTLLANGHGAHRIEGIGDKHVPWVLDCRLLDFLAAIDDAACLRLLRLFNEPEGEVALVARGVPGELVARLGLLGISGVANVLGCVKMARHYELGPRDVLVTVATDSAAMYQSRLEEMRRAEGPYTALQAAVAHERYLLGQVTDAVEELGMAGRRRLHNLKYFTWVEQQGMALAELDAQWHDHAAYWAARLGAAARCDALITQFNLRVGLVQQYAPGPARPVPQARRAKLLVVAIGGNALLQAGQRGTVAEQEANLERACANLLRLLEEQGCDRQLVVTHGNGPQVGLLVQQNQLAADPARAQPAPPMPLDVWGAATQGWLGYLLQRSLQNALNKVVAVVTEVVVEAADPAFARPTKPIGLLCPTAEEAARTGRPVAHEPGKGWRAVVPSPAPRGTLQGGAVRALAEAGYVVVACGGGGVPVTLDPQGQARGVEAVVDKDLASAALAVEMGADHLLILTDVEAACLGWRPDSSGARQPRPLGRVTVEQARQYLAQGEFGAGSMAPKVRAAADFAAATGRAAIIASLDRAAEALRGEAGTRVVASSAP